MQRIQKVFADSITIYVGCRIWCKRGKMVSPPNIRRSTQLEYLNRQIRVASAFVLFQRLIYLKIYVIVIGIGRQSVSKQVLHENVTTLFSSQPIVFLGRGAVVLTHLNIFIIGRKNENWCWHYTITALIEKIHLGRKTILKNVCKNSTQRHSTTYHICNFQNVKKEIIPLKKL